MSALSQIILPRAIRNTPPVEPAKWKIQQTVRTKTRVVHLLQMTSCVLYQAVVSCTWVMDRSFSAFDLVPLVYMFAVTWSTLILSSYHHTSMQFRSLFYLAICTLITIRQRRFSMLERVLESEFISCPLPP